MSRQLSGSLIGLSTTGEERQVDFTGKGNVLVQSTELGLLGRLRAE